MKKLIKNFFLDRLIYIIFMLFNSILLTIFYKFTVGENVEIVYPFIITIFLVFVVLIIDWIRYSGFNKDMEGLLRDKNHRIRTLTREQKEISKAIKQINLKHGEKEQDILNEYENKIYFLSSAIHKFKNYISVIGFIIDKNKDRTVELDLVLREIESENDNLCISLDHVLNYIRLDSFSNDFEPVTVNLHDEVKSIININKSTFLNNDVFPILNCNDEDFSIITDEKWNRVIIEQIVINAIKYSSGKGKSKRLYFNIEKSNNNIQLTIKDEGMGIPSYDLKKVFEPFFTGENGRKIRNSTGIGLYLVREIATKLGHEVSIESEVNRGTKVSVKYLSKL